MAAVSVSRFCWVVISLRNPEISETLKTNISQQCWEEHTALISGENRGSDIWNNELQTTNNYLKECPNLTDGAGTRRRQIWKKCYCLRNIFLYHSSRKYLFSFSSDLEWRERHRNFTDSNWEWRHGRAMRTRGALSPYPLFPLGLSLPYLLINNCTEITRGTLNVYILTQVLGGPQHNLYPKAPVSNKDSSIISWFMVLRFPWGFTPLSNMVAYPDSSTAWSRQEKL